MHTRNYLYGNQVRSLNFNQYRFTYLPETFISACTPQIVRNRSQPLHVIQIIYKQQKICKRSVYIESISKNDQ